jgi:hypothetical protein
MRDILRPFLLSVKNSQASDQISRSLFLRLMGLVYGAAFVSIWLQIEGLVGAQGILPVAEFLPAVTVHLGADAWWRVPTLCWLSASDAMLNGLCGAGVLASVALIIGYAPAVCLAILWTCYLSIVSVCRDFMGFQWDILLLEAGFLALLWAPLSIRPRWVWGGQPSRIATWLIRWLLFRLMFSSGMVKWLSGDTVWRNLRALDYHYETQPLPSWTSWYAHQLPDWLQTFSTAAMFFIEVPIPFLVFAPARWRLWGVGSLAALQTGIAVTGNYGFFNALTLVLCLALVDDCYWRRVLPRWALNASPNTEWPRWVRLLVGSLVLLLSTVELAATLRLEIPWPDGVYRLQRQLRPFHLSASYGLFAVMTTDRPEIIIEGSQDGEVWQAYPFKWKPGALGLVPAFVAPHMPRLDWQMWFATLGGSYQRYPWFTPFMVRLLQGSPTVLGLLARDPFGGKPPKYVRAQLYEYWFTDWETRRRTGNWWGRKERGSYLPPSSLQAGASD